jgi:predicted RNA binding protein YcfA (HicA-like mRNA interferase family)
LPRLKCTYRRIVEILEAHGFTQEPTKASSHRKFTATRGGVAYVVIVAYHKLSDEACPGTLKSIIRTSGLPETLFRR